MWLTWGEATRLGLTLALPATKTRKTSRLLASFGPRTTKLVWIVYFCLMQKRKYLKLENDVVTLSYCLIIRNLRPAEFASQLCGPLIIYVLSLFYFVEEYFWVFWIHTLYGSSYFCFVDTIYGFWAIYKSLLLKINNYKCIYK